MNEYVEKEKEFEKKKSNNLLKGAAAGAVVGGGTIFAGNNAVYAAENEQDLVVAKEKHEELIESQYASQSTTESLSQTNSETVEYETEDEAYSATLYAHVAQDEDEGITSFLGDFEEDRIAVVSDGEVLGDTTTTAETNIVVEDASVSTSTSLSLASSTSLSTAESDIKEKSLSHSTSTNKAESESQSYSEFESASLSTSILNFDDDSLSASTSLFTAESEFQNEYEKGSTSLSQAEEEFKNSSNYNKKLDEIKEEIDDTKDELDKIHGFLLNESNPDLNDKYRINGEKKSWYDVADKLAVKLAQYMFLQTYGVGNITSTSGYFHKDYLGNFQGNYIKIEYTTSAGVKHTGYFDYIELDDNGNYAKKRPKEATQILVTKKELASNKTDILGNPDFKKSFNKYQGKKTTKGQDYFSYKQYSNNETLMLVYL